MDFVSAPGTGKASTEVSTFSDLREFGRAADTDDRVASHSGCYADFKNTARCPNEINTTGLCRRSMEVMDGKREGQLTSKKRDFERE